MLVYGFLLGMSMPVKFLVITISIITLVFFLVNRKRKKYSIHDKMVDEHGSMV
jgi:hypothetical protein